MIQDWRTIVRSIVRDLAVLVKNNHFMPDYTVSNLSRNIKSKYKQLIRTTKTAAATATTAAAIATATDR